MRALSDGPEPRRVLPGEYPLWDRALALLNRDLAVTLPGREPLRLLALPSDDADEPENVYVALANGEWHGNCLYPDSADDPARVRGPLSHSPPACLPDQVVGRRRARSKRTPFTAYTTAVSAKPASTRSRIPSPAIVPLVGRHSFGRGSMVTMTGSTSLGN
ncbi:hypothetical protein [Streptomyces sp. NPDC048560]|uniref:hypothetical protein n=1 Tax=Streptomyces sp. NPDC048560 TaxID=3155488 RepID=UPI00343DC4F3